MGEVLSQSEIDNLLAALSTGELDVDQMQETGDKQVKDYDFKRPAKFSKEHLRTLEIIYEHYGRLLSTNLPVYLRKNIQVSVSSSETVTFSEFTNSLNAVYSLNYIPLRISSVPLYESYCEKIFLISDISSHLGSIPTCISLSVCFISVVPIALQIKYRLTHFQSP